MFKPWPHQKEAIDKLSSGSVLVGSTGSGKSLVGLIYFYEKVLGGDLVRSKQPTIDKDLYVITTAMKRDSLDWQRLATYFGISTGESGIPNTKLIVDSWNNIRKYENVRNAFFIFDEQKTTGSGVWAKSFIKMAKQNSWILLTATPADTWMGLISVFIANGFYRNKTDFIRQHVIYAPYTKYPKILKYTNVETLKRHVKKIMVIMPFKRRVEIINEHVLVDYDREAINNAIKNQWNPYEDRPMRNMMERIHVIRRILNSHESRINELIKLQRKIKKLIIFYNFDYELMIMRGGFSDIKTGEHNGHKHDPLPEGDSWVYLVQYMSGNEAWECFATNHMAFYSLTHSYTIFTQARGRINRMNSQYEKLFYYSLGADYILDRSILKALENKKDFNMKSLHIFQN